MWLFAHPGGPVGFLTDAFAAGGFAETALRGLANGKFLALLTLLFGVGMELQYRSAMRRGVRWPGRYLVRAAVLFVEGFLHYLLVFEFDVFMGYAITSMLVAYLIGRTSGSCRRGSSGSGRCTSRCSGWGTALLIALPDERGGAVVGPDATASWVDQVGLRLDAIALFGPRSC